MSSGTLFGGEAHTVLAVGYRIVNGSIQFLTHSGWHTNHGNGRRDKAWFSPVLIETIPLLGNLYHPFLWGYGYIDFSLFEVGNHRVGGIGDDESHRRGIDDFYYINRVWPFYSHNAYINIANILAAQDFLFPGRPIIGAQLRFNFSSNRNDTIIAELRNTTNPSELHDAPLLGTLPVVQPNASSGVARINIWNHLNNNTRGIISLSADINSFWSWPCGHRVTFSNPQLELDFEDGLIIDGTTVTGFSPSRNFRGDVRIPEGITAIGDHAFAGNDSINFVFFSSTVTTIGTGAFENTANLWDIQLPPTAA